MSFLGIHILSDKALGNKIAAAAKSAGHEVQTVLVNDLDKAIAAAKATEIGKAATDAIKTVEDHSLTGEQKMLKAIGIVAPVVIQYVAKGGVHAVYDDVKELARGVVESTLADVKATKTVGIAKAILSLLGMG